MTPSLEWTGYLPAAVSAVHALGALARLCRERGPARGKPPGPWGCPGRCCPYGNRRGYESGHGIGYLFGSGALFLRADAPGALSAVDALHTTLDAVHTLDAVDAVDRVDPVGPGPW
ncbi:hypothetical protein [Streptomyces sp. cg36]|uniref:hypothetical protein n=1 Tax=Streptomyces sp. cg36 TaxID=3238798 RepID=UPI0034E1FE20